ncbi:hypothetical protein BD410DRAFT_585651 [Rickenella mellea]|uniref:Uncharacterized protein n=1 Tax=Rickenella mellea TaxID=50990 RepID=A0A4Y7PPP9_9AGAM|nr:hypothetical protein BD410DRAFT_585651 [Rickenella mellea]
MRFKLSFGFQYSTASEADARSAVLQTTRPSIASTLSRSVFIVFAGLLPTHSTDSIQTFTFSHDIHPNFGVIICWPKNDLDCICNSVVFPASDCILAVMPFLREMFQMRRRCFDYVRFGIASKRLPISFVKSRVSHEIKALRASHRETSDTSVAVVLCNDLSLNC